MDERKQKMRLIVNGAISIYESEGLDIAKVLQEQHREDLLVSLDAVTTALYWLQSLLLES